MLIDIKIFIFNGHLSCKTFKVRIKIIAFNNPPFQLVVQNKIGSLIVIHDPNPWVLSQYAPKRNPETFLATEQCKTCFNSHKVSPLLDEC